MSVGNDMNYQSWRFLILPPTDSDIVNIVDGSEDLTRRRWQFELPRVSLSTRLRVEDVMILYDTSRYLELDMSGSGGILHQGEGAMGKEQTLETREGTRIPW